MKPFFAIIAFLCMFNTVYAQENKLPYSQIPEYPDTYTPALVVARMIDGLGYRYYWVTKDLRAEDLAYKPSEEARSTAATLQHIYGLSNTIAKTATGRPIEGRPEALTYPEIRKRTLLNLERASKALKKQNPALEDRKIVYKRGDDQTVFPMWNLLNGPLADAIYHTGQVVSFRRTSGNPIQQGVNVLTGKTNIE